MSEYTPLQQWLYDTGFSLPGTVLKDARRIESSQWLAEVIREAKREGWDEGFDAGERDVFNHVTFDEPCIENPYRKEQQ